jgi:hypothetical protein
MSIPADSARNSRGVGIAQVAELMGHTSTEMVSSVFGHLVERLSHMWDAAKKAVE